VALSAPVAAASTAEPLAARLPTRRGIAWKVSPAPYGIRPNAAMSRITNGRRSLIIVEQAGLVELYADRPGDFPVRPEIRVSFAGQSTVDALASHALRSTLPVLDAEIVHETIRTRGTRHVLVHRAGELTEVGFGLVDWGVAPSVTLGVNGPSLNWRNGHGGVWRLELLGENRDMSLSYDGPVSGLLPWLIVLFEAGHGHDPASGGSVFTRYLTDQFPQLRATDADEIHFGGYRAPVGFIALPDKAVPTDQADESTQVVATFGSLGADLLLASGAHLT